MPAKTTLAALQSAMEIDDVKTHLDAYAVGILAYEQSHNRKNQFKAQVAIKNELKSMSPSSQVYQEKLELLKAIENSHEMGFYYTIALFDSLAETHPQEAKKMIEAVLSFDLTGRYSLDKRLILVDGHPFVLDEVLKKRGIDFAAFKEMARINQLNTEFILDPTEEAEPLAAIPPSFSLPENFGELTEATRDALIELNRGATTVCNSQLLRMRADSLSLDFTQVSQFPTKENIRAFLSVLSEIFSHAKTQDSAKLETLNFAADQSKISAHSTVAFLQNTLCNWMILSLVEAPTIAILEQRLMFLMAVFAEANKKEPHLPLDTSADMYLPLFILSKIAIESALSSHPLVYPNLKCMQDMSARSNASAVASYIGHIKPVPPKSLKVPEIKRVRSLSPMRMEMTTRLAFSEEIAQLVDRESQAQAAISAAKQSIARGESIYNYFNPRRQRFGAAISKISTKASAIFNDQPAVHFLFKDDAGIYALVDLISTVFPIHKATDNLAKQLQTLEGALFSKNPRIYYFRKPGKLVGLEGGDALDYIAKQLVNCKLEGSKSKLIEYSAAVNAWCDNILMKIEQLKSGATQAHDTKPRSVSAPEQANFAASTLPNISFFKADKEKTDVVPPAAEVSQPGHARTSFSETDAGSREADPESEETDPGSEIRSSEV